MIKYDRKIVLDYILGEDIETYELEELENDTNFMIDVIRLSKDEKMYNFASDEVKKDYSFVKTVVETFRKDEDFIIDVAEFYFENTSKKKEENNIFELSIIIDKFVKSKEKRIHYAIKSYVSYLSYKVQVDFYMLETNEKVGFEVAMEIYKDYPLIVNYIARQMIDDIFYEKDIPVNQSLHKKIKSKDMIQNNNVNKFIIDYISCIDNCLAGYVQTKLCKDNNYLSNLRKDITNCLMNWDSYENALYKRKIDIICQEGIKTYDSYKTSYTFYQFLNTVIANNGLEDIYNKYLPEFIMLPIIDDFVYLGDISFYDYLEKLVLKELTDKKIDKNYTDYDVKESKIIPFSKEKKKTK